MRISVFDSRAKNLISNHFREGGIVVYPTDTVYGLGTLPLESNDIQIRKIYEIKQRPVKKPLSLLITEEMIDTYIEAEPGVLSFLRENWPGRLTVILKCKKNITNPLSSLLNLEKPDLLAFRVPKNEYLLEIINLVGFPIIGTSANISGSKPKSTFESVLNELDSDDITLWVDGGKLPAIHPSTLLDLSNPKQFKILRRGSGQIIGFNKIVKEN